MLILTTPQSGSVAGVTSSRNRFGQYQRTRAIPVQPRTPKQTRNRALFTVNSSAWRGLTDAQRTAWNDYAAQIIRSGRLGSSYSPTGASLFTGAAIAIGELGTQSDAPVDLPTYSLAIQSITYTDPTPGPEALVMTIGAANANNLLLVETSGPVSAGITSSAAIRRWQSLPSSSSNNEKQYFVMTSTSVAILTEYKYLFPSPVAGQVIWFRVREIFFDSAGNGGIVNQNYQHSKLVVP